MLEMKFKILMIRALLYHRCMADGLSIHILFSKVPFIIFSLHSALTANVLVSTRIIVRAGCADPPTTLHDHGH